MSEVKVDLDALVARLRAERQEDRKQDLEETRRIMRAEIEAEAARARGLPDDTLGEIFARWDREVLDPPGRESPRSDTETARAFVPLILDLPFRRGDSTQPPLAQGWITLRNVPCSSLTGEIAESWRQELKITPKRKPRKKGKTEYYADGTVNRVVGILQGAIKWALGGESERSPVRGLKHEDTSGQARKGYFRDEQQFADFLRLCKPTLVDMLRLSVNNGGMRKSEVRLLQIKEVDWQAHTIRFPAGKRTKNRKGREFPVRDEEWGILVRRRSAAEAIGTTYLFCGRRDNPRAPIPSRTIVDWMRQAARDWRKLVGDDAATLNGETPVYHHGRHTWGTWAGAKGYGFDGIMDEGGWLDVKVARGYVKRAPAVVERARRMLSRTLADVVEDEDARKLPRRGGNNGGTPPAAASAA